MPTAQKTTVGKNALWQAYQDASPLVKGEIALELRKVNLYRHWYSVACKEGYNLKMAYAPFRDIFLRIMPETAPLFGLDTKN